MKPIDFDKMLKARIVQYSYNQNTKETTIWVDKYKLKYIVLNRLNLGTAFTLRNIKTAWYKRERNGDIGCWFPGTSFVEPVLDELLGKYLNKKYISVKLTHGSVTESLYTRLK